MIYDRELLGRLDELRADRWEGAVFRHMFGDYPPERENQRGARWNPAEIPAIYAIRIVLSSVIDLSDRTRLTALGVSAEDLAALDHGAGQRVGGAIAWLGHDGLLVPSARADGVNLVIFPNGQAADYEFRVLASEVLEPGG